MLADEHGQRAAAQPQDQDAARVFRQRQPGQHDRRVRQRQIFRIARFHDALPCPAFLETQSAQSRFVLRDDNRAVGRSLFVEDALVRMRRNDQRREDEQCGEKCAAVHKKARLID